MKLQYAEIDVVLKDRANIARIRVPVWEVPILEAVHAGGVSVVRDITEERPAPSSDSEYDRLMTVYGNSSTDDGAQGPPYVAAVYGSMGEGKRRLKEAMQQAVLPRDAEVTPFTSPKMNAALAASVLHEVSDVELTAADSDDLIG